MSGLLPAAYEPSRLLRGAPATLTADVSVDEDLRKTGKEIVGGKSEDRRVPLYVPYADFFQYQAGAGRLAGRASARTDAARAARRARSAGPAETELHGLLSHGSC